MLIFINFSNKTIKKNNKCVSYYTLLMICVVPVSQLELVYDNIRHIKCVSSCVTEGLDRKTSYFKRQAGKHATLFQPKTSDYLPL